MTEGSLEQPASPGKALVKREDPGPGDEWADLRTWARWGRRHEVLLAGIALIVLQLAWKAQFLSQEYFRADDFKVLDKAIASPFSWSYLTYDGAGHLLIGPRAVAWVLARISLYNWGLDSAVNLVLVACAGLAALRLLRALFGDRRMILIPLLVYLLCPLTLPALGEWSSGLEAVPLQLAIFMAVTAHVWHVRTGRARHLVAAACWVAIGLIFFEKALVLPLLLFAITSAFLAGGRSWLDGMRVSLQRLWPPWAAYGALMAGYAVVLKASFRSSAVLPAAPSSANDIATFAWSLIRNTFVPGAIGGPWRWYPPGGSYAVTATPSGLSLLALAVAVAVIAATIWHQGIAWRAWVILAGWLVVADMLPVVIGRLDYLPINILGLETRYVADAVPLLAICLGLALMPVTDEPPAAVASHGTLAAARDGQRLRAAASALVGVFVFGSVWSAQAYEFNATGQRASSYIANASLELKLAPRGTLVVDSTVPGAIVLGTFGAPVAASTLIRPLERGTLAGKLRWITSPDGTLGQLMIFGPDGLLRRASVVGASSGPRPGNRNCWPARRGQIVVKFLQLPPRPTRMLRIGYLWYSRTPAVVFVTYRSTVRSLVVRPGLNSGYLPVTGPADGISIGSPGGGLLCVGDVEAGVIGPAPPGQ